MNKIIFTIIIGGFLFFCAALSLPLMTMGKSTGGLTVGDYEITEPAPIEKIKVPEELEWITNNNEPIYASPEAKKGGTYYQYMISFPPTLRYVGPNSNSSFRRISDDNRLYLLSYHPNTLKPVPSLATHWAYGKDKRTVYFKLDPEARWSDGAKVTAHDFLFMLDFYRSEHITDLWYNDFYNEFYESIKAYDLHTISITMKKEKSPKQLLEYTGGLRPVPAHFHKEKMDKDWVEYNDWRVEPTTGPYVVDKIEKGSHVIVKRQKDWWAKGKRLNKNRFNVDRVVYKVVRSPDIAFIQFKLGELDSFNITKPKFWHTKAKGELFDNGYIKKIWFYTQRSVGLGGMWLNTSKGLLKDVNIRKGLEHSINMEGMVRDVLRGDYTVMDKLTIGYGEMDYPTPLRRFYDLKKAGEFFDKAGFDKFGEDGVRVNAEGERLTVRLTEASNGIYKNQLLYLAEDAMKAGIKIEFEFLDSTTGFKKILNKEHDIAWVHFAGGGTDPGYHQFFHSQFAGKPSNNNITNLNDPEMDELTDAFRSAVNDKEMVELAHKIQKRFYDLCPIILSRFYDYHRTAYWSYVKTPKNPLALATMTSEYDCLEPYGAFGGLFWIDEEEKEKVKKMVRSGDKYSEPVELVDETFRRKKEGK